jgi:alpha-galactosidase/6-phospho-beta-glucosidase family protein
LEYAELEEKAAAATARFNELSAQIKATETRMTEIGNLKSHIINYSKTRDVYTAYRKAGYSKQFLSEHEGDILLHKAAKKAFDELGVKTLPTVRALQAEYAERLTEKKKAYAKYVVTRKEMKELLTAKANIDKLLGDEREQKESKRELNR